MVVRVVTGQQAVAHASLIGSAAVLAEFALTCQAADGQAEADDRLEQVVDVLAGRVTDRPRRGSIGLMALT